MDHIWYRLKKLKIAFEQHRIIDSKLYQPMFNYSNFYTINYFAQYIQVYDSIINYNTVYSKMVYKYLLKVLYNKINKKEEYNSQI